MYVSGFLRVGLVAIPLNVHCLSSSLLLKSTGEQGTGFMQHKHYITLLHAIMAKRMTSLHILCGQFTSSDVTLLG